MASRDKNLTRSKSQKTCTHACIFTSALGQVMERNLWYIKLLVLSKCWEQSYHLPADLDIRIVCTPYTKTITTTHARTSLRSPENMKKRNGNAIMHKRLSQNYKHTPVFMRITVVSWEVRINQANHRQGDNCVNFPRKRTLRLAR